MIPPDLTWVVTADAAKQLDPLRKQLGEDDYAEEREALQWLLCNYFMNDGRCTASTRTIWPMGGTPKGGKCFKIRWGTPGSGKSGGLRLAVVAYCDRKRVVVTGAWVRRDVDETLFGSSFGSADDSAP